MSAEKWFVLESTERQTSEIRVWEAGDGLTCSFRTSRSKVACGAPVATMKSTTIERPWASTGSTKRVRSYLMCEHHVANALSGAGYKVPGITTEADKEAREAVLAAHWDEYQDELSRRVSEKRDAELAKLPDALRAAFAKITDAAEAEA